MSGKYEEELADLKRRGIDIWKPFFHRQYEGAYDGRIRRQYMDLASPPFYPKVFEIVSIKPHESVLDLGCGDGTDIVHLLEQGHYGHIAGYETPVTENPEASYDKADAITQNVLRAGGNNFELHLGYAEELDFEDESFDTVWAANVLQEVSDIDRVVSQIHRVLKPGGKLVAITNHIDNKPLHHRILKDMATRIGGVPPQPYSSRFNSMTGPTIMARHRHEFRFVHEIVQEGRKNLRLTEENLPYLMASLASYWNDIMPQEAADGHQITLDELIKFAIQLQGEKGAIMRDVEANLLKAIDASPSKAIYDTIKRVAIIYKKRSRPMHVVMSSLKQ